MNAWMDDLSNRRAVLYKFTSDGNIPGFTTLMLSEDDYEQNKNTISILIALATVEYYSTGRYEKNSMQNFVFKWE